VEYLEGIPKQLRPKGRHSTDITGSAFSEGYPGAGITVPETNVGRKGISI